MYRASSILHLQQNVAIWRRMEHKVLDASYFEAVTFDWRLIARNTLRFNITLHNLQKDIHLAEANIEGYHRYLRWQRMTGSMWENLCDVGNPMKFTPIWDAVLRNLVNMTNLPHRCPYVRNETIYVVADDVATNKIRLPFMPSGQYRLDLTLTDGRQRHPFFFFQLFIDVDDHRAIVV